MVLLDHGLTVPLEHSLVDSLRAMVQSLTAGDFDGLASALSGAGLQLGEQVDIVTLLQLVGILLGNEAANDTEDPVDIGVRLGTNMGSIPVNLLLVGRALGLLDGITKLLDAELDTLEIVAHYI